MDELQHISKFDLQQLLRKDKETRDNVKDVHKIYNHNILLSFNVSSTLHIEFIVNLINNVSSKYALVDYKKLLKYLNTIYELNDIIPCSGFIFKNDDVGSVHEFSIVEINDVSKISTSSCLNGTLEENVLTSEHLVSLKDCVAEV